MCLPWFTPVFVVTVTVGDSRQPSTVTIWANLPQSSVKITLSDVEFIHGKSGVGMRMTLNVGLVHPRFGNATQSTKGCLAFRDRKNVINVLTPVIYLGPSKIRYRPITLSPGLTEWLRGEIERVYGSFIKRHQTAPGSGISAHRVGADLELELDLGGAA